MKNLYPHFKVLWKNDTEVEFIGTLSVKQGFPVYTVTIHYRGALAPLVRVVSPALVANPPHYYHNTDSLCLYYPNNYRWINGKIVARDIVSWTAAWIYFYEVWLRKKIWYGPEAPHGSEAKIN